MTGLLFIINVPQKDHELSLHKNDSCVLQSKYICRSKDDVHTPMSTSDFYKGGLYKSKSEITLNIAETGGGESYLKSSWGEIKQVLKTKRNKLKITRPIRSLDVLGAFHWNTPLETVSAEIFWAFTSNGKTTQIELTKKN